MDKHEIIAFLKENTEPLKDYIAGHGYRASAHLKDGVFLPCVIFYNPYKFVDLALRRFDEERLGNGCFSGTPEVRYREIVKHFITKGNRIVCHDIHKVEKSKNAFPLAVLNEIQGETSMSFTGFVARMKDGKCFSFGTRYLFEFFHMPDGYSVDEIEEIINHSYVSETGEIKSYRRPDGYPDENITIYRERPYFVCYVDEL